MSKTSGTVVIGCKFPNGLTLEIGTYGDPGYEFVRIKGANEGTMHESGVFVPTSVGGFGRTTISADFWNKWSNGVGLVGGELIFPRGQSISAEANTRSMVEARKAQVREWQEKGLLFVVDNMDLSLAAANEKASTKTGFEPLARMDDARAKAEAPGVTKAA